MSVLKYQSEPRARLFLQKSTLSFPRMYMSIFSREIPVLTSLGVQIKSKKSMNCSRDVSTGISLEKIDTYILEKESVDFWRNKQALGSD